MHPNEVIEQWFKKRCDGRWEHQFGLSITTTDNPGWLLSADQRIDVKALQESKMQLGEDSRAEFITEAGTVKVWAPTLKECLEAAATVLK